MIEALDVFKAFQPHRDKAIVVASGVYLVYEQFAGQRRREARIHARAAAVMPPAE